MGTVCSLDLKIAMTEPSMNTVVKTPALGREKVGTVMEDRPLLKTEVTESQVFASQSVEMGSQ